MKLHIENFAKILHADIEFDGLTVLAGANNTGKSTIGKILYSFYRSFSNKEQRIRSERLNSMCAAVTDGLRMDRPTDIEKLIIDGNSLEKIVEALLNGFWQAGAKMGMPEPNPVRRRELIDSYVAKIRPKYEEALRMEDGAYAMRIVARVFDCVFHRQYHPIFRHEGESKLVLTVKGQDNVFSFSATEGRCWNPTNFLNKAYFISSPDVLSLCKESWRGIFNLLYTF